MEPFRPNITESVLTDYETPDTVGKGEKVFRAAVVKGSMLAISHCRHHESPIKVPNETIELILQRGQSKVESVINERNDQIQSLLQNKEKFSGWSSWKILGI